MVDALFFAVLAVTIGARWIEQRSSHGATTEGKVSTWADFRRYAATLSCFSIAAWIVANVVGNYLLNGATASLL